MIDCLWTRVRNQPIIALYFESETALKFYNLEAAECYSQTQSMLSPLSWPKLIGLLVHSQSPHGK